MGGIPRFLKYVFPASINTEIAQVQSLGAAGTMLLNGPYADPTRVNPNVSILSQGFSSVVSLTSVNNNSAVEFTVNGYQNGVFITETIAGPNNDSVETTGIYDSVSSITTSAAIDGVSSGIGSQAFFAIVSLDFHALIPCYGFQIYWNGAAEGNIYQTIDQVINNNFTYAAMIALMPGGPLNPSLLGNGTFAAPQFFMGTSLTVGGSYIFYIDRTGNNTDITLVFRQAA